MDRGGWRLEVQEGFLEEPAFDLGTAKEDRVSSANLSQVGIRKDIFGRG